MFLHWCKCRRRCLRTNGCVLPSPAGALAALSSPALALFAFPPDQPQHLPRADEPNSAGPSCRTMFCRRPFPGENNPEEEIVPGLRSALMCFQQAAFFSWELLSRIRAPEPASPQRREATVITVSFAQLIPASTTDGTPPNSGAELLPSLKARAKHLYMFWLFKKFFNRLPWSSEPARPDTALALQPHGAQAGLPVLAAARLPALQLRPLETPAAVLGVPLR